MTSISSSREGKLAPGFTLVELLIVISIIVILIAILLPSLNKARAAAMAIQCGSNERQIFAGFQLYAADNRGFIPPVIGLHSLGSPSWADYLWGGNGESFIGPRYLSTAEVFYCPAQYYRQSNGGSGAFRGNYGMNKVMNTINAYGELAPGVTYIIDPYNSSQIFFYKLCATFRSSEVYLLGDSSLASPTSQNYTIDMSTTYPDFRHPTNQMEMLFHDGHVEKLPSNEIPTTGTYPHSYAPPWWPPANP